MNILKYFKNQFKINSSINTVEKNNIVYTAYYNDRGDEYSNIECTISTPFNSQKHSFSIDAKIPNKLIKDDKPVILPISDKGKDFVVFAFPEEQKKLSVISYASYQVDLESNSINAIPYGEKVSLSNNAKLSHSSNKYHSYSKPKATILPNGDIIIVAVDSNSEGQYVTTWLLEKGQNLEFNVNEGSSRITNRLLFKIDENIENSFQLLPANQNGNVGKIIYSDSTSLFSLNVTESMVDDIRNGKYVNNKDEECLFAVGKERCDQFDKKVSTPFLTGEEISSLSAVNTGQDTIIAFLKNGQQLCLAKLTGKKGEKQIVHNYEGKIESLQLSVMGEGDVIISAVGEKNITQSTINAENLKVVAVREFPIDGIKTLDGFLNVIYNNLFKLTTSFPYTTFSTPKISSKATVTSPLATTNVEEITTRRSTITTEENITNAATTEVTAQRTTTEQKTTNVATTESTIQPTTVTSSKITTQAEKTTVSINPTTSQTAKATSHTISSSSDASKISSSTVSTTTPLAIEEVTTIGSTITVEDDTTSATTTDVITQTEQKTTRTTASTTQPTTTASPKTTTSIERVTTTAKTTEETGTTQHTTTTTETTIPTTQLTTSSKITTSTEKTTVRTTNQPTKTSTTKVTLPTTESTKATAKSTVRSTSGYTTSTKQDSTTVISSSKSTTTETQSTTTINSTAALGLTTLASTIGSAVVTTLGLVTQNATSMLTTNSNPTITDSSPNLNQTDIPQNYEEKSLNTAEITAAIAVPISIIVIGGMSYLIYRNYCRSNIRLPSDYTDDVGFWQRLRRRFNRSRQTTNEIQLESLDGYNIGQVNSNEYEINQNSESNSTDDLLNQNGANYSTFSSASNTNSEAGRSRSNSQKSNNSMEWDNGCDTGSVQYEEEDETAHSKADVSFELSDVEVSEGVEQGRKIEISDSAV